MAIPIDLFDQNNKQLISKLFSFRSNQTITRKIHSKFVLKNR